MGPKEKEKGRSQRSQIFLSYFLKPLSNVGKVRTRKGRKGEKKEARHSGTRRKGESQPI